MLSHYRIELFDKKQHDIAVFCCGVDALDTYLKERASQDIKRSIAAIYVLREHDSQNVIGYYSLSNYSIELSELPIRYIQKMPKYRLIPTTLIGRLAIHKNSQGKKIGGHLLLDALVRSYTISKKMGSFAVIAEAKDSASRSFYERYGFKQFPNTPFKLFLEMGSIQKLVDG